MSEITVYTYSGCDTCRKAVAWLRSHGITFDEKPIRVTPPSDAELRAMLAHLGGDLRKLFNTSGRDYREFNMGEQLKTLDTDTALHLLAGNGNLVKRPFLIGGGVGLVGFREETWAAALTARA